VCPVCLKDQDEACHGSRPRLTRHCVRCGPGSIPKGHSSPPLFAHVYCCQTAGWIKMPLGMKVGLGPGDIVLDGNPTSSPQKEHNSQFLALVCCGQTAGWIKMPLSRPTGVGLGQGNIVLNAKWGPSFPPTERDTAVPPLFGPCLLWPNGRPSRLLLSSCTSWLKSRHYRLTMSYGLIITLSR